MRLRSVIVVVVIGALLAMPGTVLPQSQKKRTIVLGEDFAKARAAEERRKQKGKSGKTPMPATTYDFWRGDESLINPAKNSLDSELIGLCERFAKSNARARAGLRNSIQLGRVLYLTHLQRFSRPTRQDNAEGVR